MKKIGIVVITAVLIVSMLSGCSESGGNRSENSMQAGSSSTNENASTSGGSRYIKELSKMIEKYQEAASLIENHPKVAEFEKAEPARKAELALELADDMAMSCVLDFENDATFALAAEMVEQYPHPLLLNNFGSMLAEKSREDSLFFFLTALEQDPENPVILTNAANLFIEINNFSEAESCARRALKTAPDFGPAYQILTTVHLKNGDDILAAETMVKSAKHCFNDITIHHFESFLEAVEELDPETDEYPLKEEFIKELYLIAKENVDTQFIYEGLDTPEAQLKLKPFPKMDTIDLSSKYSYFYEMEQEVNFISYDVKSEYNKYLDAVDDYLNDNTGGGEGVYPIQKNLRQIYAFRVLQSYYLFKLEKCRIAYEKEMDKINEQASEALSKIDNEHSEQNREDFDNFSPETKEEIIEKHNDSMDDWGRNLEKQKTVLNGLSPRAISLSKDCYNEIKQIMEEYWLRSGGLIKYITNEDVLVQFDLERTLTVYEYISVPLDGMLVWTGNYGNLDVSFAAVDVLASIYESMEGISAEDGNAGIHDPAKSEKEEDEDSLVPDIEKQAISTFNEEGDLPDIGFEGDVFGFGGSIQTDGERLKYSLDTPASSMGQSKNLLYDEPWDKCYVESYYALGSKAQGSTEWFIENSKTVKEAVGKGAKIIGNIGFSSGTLEGGYVCQSKNGKITDRGIIHIREVGGSIGKFGKSDIVVVKKSSITGVAIKENSTKYKFGIGSMNVK